GDSGSCFASLNAYAARLVARTLTGWSSAVPGSGSLVHVAIRRVVAQDLEVIEDSAAGARESEPGRRRRRGGRGWRRPPIILIPTRAPVVDNSCLCYPRRMATSAYARK